MNVNSGRMLSTLPALPSLRVLLAAFTSSALIEFMTTSQVIMPFMKSLRLSVSWLLPSVPLEYSANRGVVRSGLILEVWYVWISAPKSRFAFLLLEDHFIVSV